LRSEFLEQLKNGVILADGGMGSHVFQLTGRLAAPEYPYEALNLTNRELIGGIHLASLASGARVLTANTFAANELELRASGNAENTRSINIAAVEIARNAINSHRDQFPGAERIFVIGSIGPGGEAVDNYTSQIDALLAAEVDALLLETFTDIELALSLSRTISAIPDAPAVILHAALDPGVGELNWSVDPAEFVGLATDAGASVVGVNCVAPWVSTAFAEEAVGAEAVQSGAVILSAMPNAGGFERIGHRFLARANPEYMGNISRLLSDVGVGLIGGCCEVHPEHLREMSAYLKSRSSDEEPVSPQISVRDSVQPVHNQSEKKLNGEFSRKLFAGEFAVSAEMLSIGGGDSVALKRRIEFVRRCHSEGLADAIDITDGSRGIPLIPPGDLIELIRNDLDWSDDGLEFIAHFTGRDLNTLAVQSRLVGYHLRGIRNVLFVTGDPPKMSPTYPRASAVFDLNSVQMIRSTASQLNNGLDFGNAPLSKDGYSTQFTIGTGFEPESLNLKREFARLETKIDAGADYVMTQPVFDPEALTALEPYRDCTRILPGVMVLRSVQHAHRMANVPGVNLPIDVIEALEKYDDSSDQAKKGIEIASAQAISYRSEGWNGIYLMSPASLGSAIEVLKTLVSN